MPQDNINSATVEVSGQTGSGNPFNLLSPELIAEILPYLWTEDDLRNLFNLGKTDSAFLNIWMTALEEKQHPHRWASLISTNKALQSGQSSPILKAVYGQDTDARKKALLALKELFVSTDSENSTVHWQKALILAAIEAAIKAPDQMHLVHTWLDCIRPHCPRRQVRFQRLLCDSLARCPSEAISSLAGKVLHYLLLNKTEDHASNLFFFFSAMAKHAPLDVTKAYFQKNLNRISVFCEEAAPLNEIIQSANSPAKLQNSLLRARLYKLYPEYHDALQATPSYSDEGARSAMRGFTIPRLATLETLLPLLAAGGWMESLYQDEDRDGDDDHYRDEGTPLNWAASRGYFESVQCLLAAGAAVNAQDYAGGTSLARAAAGGRLEIVQCLLDAGAAVSTQDYDGWTALIWAAYNGQLKALQCLLAAGAAVSAQNNNGATALSLAASSYIYRDHLEVVECLLENGAAVNARDNRGGTALAHAASRGHLKIVQCLLENGAAVNARDNQGETALMAAATARLEVVQYLLNAGAVVDLQNESDAGLLSLAEALDYTEIVALLKESAEKAKGIDSHAVENNAHEDFLSHSSAASLPGFGATRDARRTAPDEDNSTASSSSAQPPAKRQRL